MTLKSKTCHEFKKNL